MEKVGNEGDHEKRQKAGKEMGGKTGLCKQSVLNVSNSSPNMRTPSYLTSVVWYHSLLQPAPQIFTQKMRRLVEITVF